MTEGQVTRAARRLHITQPALSGALARLRAVFNDQLFVKDGKSMRPTLRARELDPLIREALEKVRHAIGRPSFRPETSAVTVRIATSDDLELTLISKVLKRLRSAAPGIKLAIRRVSGCVRAADAGARVRRAGHGDRSVPAECASSERRRDRVCAAVCRSPRMRRSREAPDDQANAVAGAVPGGVARRRVLPAGRHGHRRSVARSSAAGSDAKSRWKCRTSSLPCSQQGRRICSLR